jgi:hypothetical protein
LSGTLTAGVGGYLVGFFVELFSLRSEIPPEAALFGSQFRALCTFSLSAEAVNSSPADNRWAISSVIGDR